MYKLIPETVWIHVQTDLLREEEVWWKSGAWEIGRYEVKNKSDDADDVDGDDVSGGPFSRSKTASKQTLRAVGIPGPAK